MKTTTEIKDEVRREKVRRPPTHPGAVLREDVLPELGISISDFAKGAHASRQTIHKILAEKKGITPAMALKIGKLIGNGPNVWLGMQQSYDLYRAEHDMAAELDGIRAIGS